MDGFDSFGYERSLKKIRFKTHQNVLIEGPSDDHERFIDEMDDPVLNGYVATNDPGDDHAARVRTVPDDRVRPDHDRVLAVVVLKVNQIV